MPLGGPLPMIPPLGALPGLPPVVSPGAPPNMPPASPGAATHRKRRLHSGGNTEIDFDERGDAIVGHDSLPPFEGGPPFFVRNRDGSVLGPMSFGELTRHLERRAAVPPRDVSGDGVVWIDLPTFASLSGLDYLAPDPVPVRNVTMLGMLEKRSLVATLARLARSRSTGRLVIMETGSGKVQRREIDVIQGAPTFVYSDRPDLQLPSLLVRRELVPQALLPEIANQVLRSQEPFIDVVLRRTGVDVFQHWPALMGERFAEIFSWRYGKFAFDASAMLRASTPFTPSLLNLLTEGVQRGFMRNELLQKLDRVMNLRLVPTDRFQVELPELQLTRAQETAVQRLLEGRPLGELLKRHAADGHVQLIMAYTLTEAELFATTAAAPGVPEE
jgi:hypothetical protein